MAAATAEEVDGGVAGGGEQKGSGVGDASAGVGAEGSNVGFLHEIVVVGQSGKPFREVGAQGWFVGLNLLGKPLGLFGRGHGKFRGVANCWPDDLKAGGDCRARCGDLAAGKTFSKKD